MSFSNVASRHFLNLLHLNSRKKKNHKLFQIFQVKNVGVVYCNLILQRMQVLLPTQKRGLRTFRWGLQSPARKYFHNENAKILCCPWRLKVFQNSATTTFMQNASCVVLLLTYLLYKFFMNVLWRRVWVGCFWNFIYSEKIQMLSDVFH